jgi:hypothetical protein
MSEDKAREAAEKWALTEGEYSLDKEGNERLDEYAIECYLAGYAAARESMKCKNCKFYRVHENKLDNRCWRVDGYFAEDFGCILHEAKV